MVVGYACGWPALAVAKPLAQTHIGEEDRNACGVDYSESQRKSNAVFGSDDRIPAEQPSIASEAFSWATEPRCAVSGFWFERRKSRPPRTWKSSVSRGAWENPSTRQPSAG